MTFPIKPIARLLLALLLAGNALALAAETLDGATQRRLNTFFSNFSEAHMGGFSQLSLTDQALLDFALTHNYINNYRKLTPSPDGLSMIVTTAQVDQTTAKYFDRTIRSHQAPSYAVPSADGDPPIFSQVRTLKPGTGGEYLAEGLIYQPGGPSPLDTQATPAAWKAAGEEVAEIARFTAVIRKVKGDGAERWVLREYQVDDINPQ